MANITREDRTSVQVVISTEIDTALEAEAEAESKTAGRKVFKSDIIRVALGEYFARRGRSVNMDVPRGGDRRSKDGG